MIARSRAETVRIVFTVTVLIILVGVAYVITVGLLHR
jgi:hypothetical protein